MDKRIHIDLRSPYSEELLEETRKYIDNFELYEEAFPSNIGLAKHLGISRRTLYNWKDDDTKPEFQALLEELDIKQQLVAWNKGLKNEYNAQLVKLLLGKHGYHDKSENTNNTNLNVNQMSDEALAAIVNSED